MQQFVLIKEIALATLVALALSVTGCNRTAAPNPNVAVHVSLCELYANPESYNGTLVTFTATITRLPGGNYVFPGSNKDCVYSLVRFEGNIQNPTLAELESSALASPGRKEFDLELTGKFDAGYSEEFKELFRYRIFPTAVKTLSPVRVGPPLAAA